MTFLSVLDSRQKNLPTHQFSYALKDGAGAYAIDTIIDDNLTFDEGKMSVWIPVASGVRRDGVGDLLEVAGINTERHQKNPICLFDHGKQVALPIALFEDRDTKNYTFLINPAMKTAGGMAFFYQGKGMDNVSRDDEYSHAIFCEQLFDMACKRLIRGGSIGYSVVRAVELPPDYERGTPKGLHLISTLMLEGSLVVLPANMDTVQKFLRDGVCCGKALSPVLVKSLAPYAEPKKAQLGYEAKEDAKEEKAIPPAEWKPGVGAKLKQMYARKTLRMKHRRKHLSGMDYEAYHIGQNRYGIRTRGGTALMNVGPFRSEMEAEAYREKALEHVKALRMQIRQKCQQTHKPGPCADPANKPTAGQHFRNAARSAGQAVRAVATPTGWMAGQASDQHVQEAVGHAARGVGRAAATAGRAVGRYAANAGRQFATNARDAAQFAAMAAEAGVRMSPAALAARGAAAAARKIRGKDIKSLRQNYRKKAADWTYWLEIASRVLSDRRTWAVIARLPGLINSLRQLYQRGVTPEEAAEVVKRMYDLYKDTDIGRNMVRGAVQGAIGGALRGKALEDAETKSLDVFISAGCSMKAVDWPSFLAKVTGALVALGVVSVQYYLSGKFLELLKRAFTEGKSPEAAAREVTQGKKSLDAQQKAAGFKWRLLVQDSDGSKREVNLYAPDLEGARAAAMNDPDVMSVLKVVNVVKAKSMHKCLGDAKCEECNKRQGVKCQQTHKPGPCADPSTEKPSFGRRVANAAGTVARGVGRAAVVAGTAATAAYLLSHHPRMRDNETLRPIRETGDRIVDAAVDDFRSRFRKSMELRRKHRKSTKNFVRRLKHSSPGSAIVHVREKDLKAAQEMAEGKGLKFSHLGGGKVKLIGDDSAADEVAKNYGRPLKG